MSTVQRIARNTTVLLLSNIANFIIGFFFTMYVARYLGAEGFGILSFAVAFTTIFSVFIDIGLQTLMIREITRDHALAPKYLGNIAVLKIFLSIATFGLIALTVNLMNYPGQTVEVVYLLGLSVVFNAFSMMFYGVFRAHEKMEFEALGQVLGSMLILAGAFWAISHDYSVVGFAWISFAVSVFTLGYSFIISAWKFVMPRVEMDLSFWRESLKQAWPFALVGIFLTIGMSIDAVMLSKMKGDEAVGWYNASDRLVLILSLVPAAYFGSVFPIMSRLHITSGDFLRFTHERSFKYMLIIAVPIGVGTTILAEKIVMLIFGFEFYPSIIVLQVIVWSMVFTFVGGVFGNLFSSVNRQMIIAWVLGSAVVLRVVLNLVLIPEHSYTGAGISRVATGAITLIFSLVLSSRIGYGISLKNIVGTIIRVSVASGIMCIPVIYFKNFYILALIPLSALLYFAVLYIIGGIDKEDKILLRQIVGRQTPG